MYFAGSFEQYLSEFLADFSAEEDAELDMLSHKCIKYLFYRYNESLVFAGIEPIFIVHTKVSPDEIVLESLQSRDWQYLGGTIMKKVESDKDLFKIKTRKGSEMLETMTKNCKILRRVHNDLFKTVAENFKHYFKSLSENDLAEIEADMINSGLNSPRNFQSATDLLMLLDYFYFINGRFPTPNEHTFVSRASLPSEVNGQELNIKKLHGVFRDSDSHGIISSQLLAALFLFLNGGDEEKAHNFLSELYQNITVSRLSTYNSFQFEAYTELLPSLNFLFRGLAMRQTETVKVEDVKTEQQLDDKYQIDPPPPYDVPPQISITGDPQNGQ